MDSLPEALELISARVDALEKRVYSLEHSTEAVEPEPLQMPETPVAQAVEDIPAESGSGMFAVLGKAMLGIAGAYVLRALMESAVLPRGVVAAVAIVYAIGWLAFASRLAAARPQVGAIYAATSALILAPMLWELTLRFNLLTAPLTAVIFGVFLATATVLGWKLESSSVASVAYGAATVAALAMSVATHHVMPFLTLILLAMLVCEYLHTFRNGLAIRPLVSFTTDLAIFLTAYIYGSAETNRLDYPALSAATLLVPSCALFLISAAAIAVRVGVQRQQISIFDTIQAVIAFLLALFSALLFEPVWAGAVLGAVCLVLAVICYTAVLSRFRAPEERRNFVVFALWAMVLSLTGIFWSLPAPLAAAVFGAVALLSVGAGVRFECRALEFHGVMYLAAAAYASNLFQYAFAMLAGAPPARPAWSVIFVAVFSVLTYAAGREQQGETWKLQLLHLIPALLAAFSVTALIAHSFLGLAAMVIVPGVFHVAFLRTLTICAVALVFAYGGAHWHRLEMTRVAYAALALMALKLMAEDLRHGRMEFIAASIFLFAVTLIAVPRLTRMQHIVQR